MRVKHEAIAECSVRLSNMVFWLFCFFNLLEFRHNSIIALRLTVLNFVRDFSNENYLKIDGKTILLC